MWYVIQVRATREHEILALLDRWVKEADEEFFVMRCMRYLRQQDAAWDNVEALAFPGYIFADTNDIDGLRERLKQIPDLTKVLGAGDEIFPVYEEEERILKLIGGKKHLIEASQGVRQGNRIVVIKGNLVGQEAMIKWVNSHKRMACIEFEISGRKVTTKVGLEIIRRDY